MIKINQLVKISPSAAMKCAASLAQKIAEHLQEFYPVTEIVIDEEIHRLAISVDGVETIIIFQDGHDRRRSSYWYHVFVDAGPLGSVQYRCNKRLRNSGIDEIAVPDSDEFPLFKIGSFVESGLKARKEKGDREKVQQRNLAVSGALISELWKEYASSIPGHLGLDPNANNPEKIHLRVDMDVTAAQARTLIETLAEIQDRHVAKLPAAS